MKIKGWKKSKHYSNPTTKMVWETENGNIIHPYYSEIDYNPSYSIPYRIIIDGRKEIDSTGTFANAKKIAYHNMKMNFSNLKD